MKVLLGPPLLLLAAACSYPHAPDPIDPGVAPPQAVTAIDVSDDGRFIGVTTLAFRH